MAALRAAVWLLCATLACAQTLSVPASPPTPLPETEVAAIFSIRQQWQGNTVVATWNGNDPCNLWNGVICYTYPSGSTNIVGVSLANANIPGPIPSEIGNFSRLNSLVLTNNQFSGTIPESLSNLFDLKKLLLSNNQLTGGIPVGFGLLPGLTIINVDNNQLDQPIPQEVFQITGLQQLSAQNNQITGNIPKNLYGAVNLLLLNLNNNQLNGSIPNALGNLTTLQSIDLSGNQLTGTIPPSLGLLPDLTFLSVANNQLSGSIPSSLANIPNLQSLWLFNNKLTGSIPRQLMFVPDFRAYGNELTSPGPAPALSPFSSRQICAPGSSTTCTCSVQGFTTIPSGQQYCASDGSAYSSCICQPQQCRTCPLGQAARPILPGASCPAECFTPLVVLLRIVNLTMANFDNVTAVNFRATLAQQLDLDLDQVALLQIAPGSVITTVAFLPPSTANTTVIDPQDALRIATTLLSQNVDLGPTFSPYQTLTVLPTGQSTTPSPTASPTAAPQVIVRVKDTNWPWFVALVVLASAILLAVLGIIVWCCLSGRCSPPRNQGPSPPHSRRFQPLLTDDPDSSILVSGGSKDNSQALMLRPPIMPYVSMPQSSSQSQRNSQGSGGNVGMQRLEQGPSSWSPAGVNEPQGALQVQGPFVGGGLRRSREEVVFEPPLRKVPVQITGTRGAVPGRSPQGPVTPSSIGLTELRGTPPSLQPAVRPAVAPPQETAVLSSVGAKEIPLSVLQTATDNFSEGNWVGTGGFGLVYRGVLPVMHCPVKVRGRRPSQDVEVAVKVLDVDASFSDRRFRDHMELLGRLKHKYLVELLGYCMEGSVRMLVYEFMAFGSLADHLHGPRPGQPQFHHLIDLTWRQRMRIAYGAARGLNYLHTPEVPSSSQFLTPTEGNGRKPVIVHRDLSTSNILLNDTMQVRISDFGLAPLMLTEAERSTSKGADTDEPPTPSDAPSTAQKASRDRSMSPQGLASPVSPSQGWTSPKSDVFAFGIVLLELLTGSPPLDESRTESQQHIIAWAKPHLSNRETIQEIVDPKLGTRAPLVELYQVAAVISMCIQPDETSRPAMTAVVQMLAPLAEAPDTDHPSEGLPESGWSGSSGTNTDRGASSNGNGSNGAKGGFEGIRPLLQSRPPAGYEGNVPGESFEGVRQAHMSPEIRPEGSSFSAVHLWPVQIPDYSVLEETLQDILQRRDAREKQPWAKKTQTRSIVRPLSEGSDASGSDLPTPDSVLAGWWAEQKRSTVEEEPTSATTADVSVSTSQENSRTILLRATNALEIEESEDWMRDEGEAEPRFVDQPRRERRIGASSRPRRGSSRNRSSAKAAGKKRSPDGGSPKEDRSQE